MKKKSEVLNGGRTDGRRWRYRAIRLGSLSPFPCIFGESCNKLLNVLHVKLRVLSLYMYVGIVASQCGTPVFSADCSAYFTTITVGKGAFLQSHPASLPTGVTDSRIGGLCFSTPVSLTWLMTWLMTWLHASCLTHDSTKWLNTRYMYLNNAAVSYIATQMKIRAFQRDMLCRSRWTYSSAVDCHKRKRGGQR